MATPPEGSILPAEAPEVADVSGRIERPGPEAVRPPEAAPPEDVLRAEGERGVGAVPQAPPGLRAEPTRPAPGQRPQLPRGLGDREGRGAPADRGRRAAARRAAFKGAVPELEATVAARAPK